MFSLKPSTRVFALFIASLIATPITAQLSVVFCTEESFSGICTPFVVDSVDNGSCINVGSVGKDVSSVGISEDPSECRLCE